MEVTVQTVNFYSLKPIGPEELEDSVSLCLHEPYVAVSFLEFYFLFNKGCQNVEQSQSWRHGVLSEGDHSLATPCRAVQIPFAKERLHSGDLLWTGRQTSSNSVLLCSFSVLRLLKEGADPHTVLSSGGSLLHLVRASVVGDTLRRGFSWGWQHGGKLYI